MKKNLIKVKKKEKRFSLWSHWAAIGGHGGLVGLQQQLHPEVHNALFGILHLWQFGKLSVKDERLHDGGHKPGRRQMHPRRRVKEPSRS